MMAEQDLVEIVQIAVADLNHEEHQTDVLENNEDADPPGRKRARMDISQETSIKSMLVSISQAICQRLDSMEAKLQVLEATCRGLVEKLDTAMGKNQSTIQVPMVSGSPFGATQTCDKVRCVVPQTNVIVSGDRPKTREETSPHASDSLENLLSNTVGRGRQKTIVLKVPIQEEVPEDQESGSETSDSVSNSGQPLSQNTNNVTLITLNSEGKIHKWIVFCLKISPVIITVTYAFICAKKSLMKSLIQEVFTVGRGRQKTIVLKVPIQEEVPEDQESGSETSDSVSNSGQPLSQNTNNVTLITLNSEDLLGHPSVVLVLFFVYQSKWVLRGPQLIAVASTDGTGGVDASPLQGNDIQVQYVQLGTVTDHTGAVQVLRGPQLIAVASTDGTGGVDASPLQGNDIQVQYVQLGTVTDHTGAVQAEALTPALQAEMDVKEAIQLQQAENGEVVQIQMPGT
ncbi:protein BANP-like [Sinocyclocheilus grahami]|uniref:protein BANP-like n=1 Tax=Sinocyclocheilus grahami TaxID=75366 RepID=UPI0007AD5D4A|nr:PREDICTED: protein BANP-like [Sinocyclocheilus grahami]